MKATYFALVVLSLALCARATYVDQLPQQLLPNICTLTMDPGSTCINEPHRPPSTRITYNLSIRRCIPFTYNGCVGNANNFDTLIECQKTCKEDATTTPAPVTAPTFTNTAAPTMTPSIPTSIPHMCIYDINNGFPCDVKKPSNRYAFSKIHRQCVPLYYNGCGGNVNSFDTLVECRKTCESNIN